MPFHTGQSFTFGETPSATKWNYLWENDYALADGTGIEDDAILARHVADSQLAANHIDWSTAGEIWWEELGRATLGVAGDTATVSGISGRKYLHILIYAVANAAGQINSRIRFNNDSGTNYAERSASNGGADSTGTSSTTIGITQSASSNTRLGVAEVLNVATQEKLVSTHVVENNGNGAGNAPVRAEVASKWANTADLITRVDLVNTGTGDFAAGTQIIVLGHD